MTTYILAEKKDGNNYVPRELAEDPQKFFGDLEYTDVANGEYQIWEYPSGKISRIEPDREVEEKLLWSTPSDGAWLPKLIAESLDKTMVTDALKSLSTQKPSLLQRLVDRIQQI